MVCHVFVFVSISVFLPRGCSCFFFLVWPRGCLFLSFFVFLPRGCSCFFFVFLPRGCSCFFFVFLPRVCSCFFFVFSSRVCLCLFFLYLTTRLSLSLFLYSYHVFGIVSFWILIAPLSFFVLLPCVCLCHFVVFLPHVCPCLSLILLPRVDRCHLKKYFYHFNFHIVFFVRFWYIFPIIDWHWTFQIESYKPSRRYFNNMSDAP